MMPWPRKGEKVIKEKISKNEINRRDIGACYVEAQRAGIRGQGI